MEVYVVFWEGILLYTFYRKGFEALDSTFVWNILLYTLACGAGLLALIRRERIEIYPEKMVWRKTYFGISRTEETPLSDVLGAEWWEGGQTDSKKSQNYLEFYTPEFTVKSGYGLTFDDFESIREHIRGMYPDLIKRWGAAHIKSKDFTLLNLN